MIKTPSYSTLFICSANQCRSPMAEGLFKSLIKIKISSNIKWEVASAGCWAYPNMAATPKAIIALKELGIDISDHSSQAVTYELIERYNLILCMENGHVEFIKRHFPDVSERVFLLSEMTNDKFEVIDPIGKSQFEYNKSAHEISSILNTGWNKIKMNSMK